MIRSSSLVLYGAIGRTSSRCGTNASKKWLILCLRFARLNDSHISMSSFFNTDAALIGTKFPSGLDKPLGLFFVF